MFLDGCDDGFDAGGADHVGAAAKGLEAAAVGGGEVVDDVGERCWGEVHGGYVEFKEGGCVEVRKEGLDEGVGEAGVGGELQYLERRRVDGVDERSVEQRVAEKLILREKGRVRCQIRVRKTFTFCRESLFKV